jgi:hypothetical protein
MIIKLHESNYKMIKSGKNNPWKKKLKNKAPTKSIKWGCQNPRVISCQTLNIKNIELKGKIKNKNQIYKRILNIKKTKKINFQRTQ